MQLKKCLQGQDSGSETDRGSHRTVKVQLLNLTAASKIQIPPNICLKLCNLIVIEA